MVLGWRRVNSGRERAVAGILSGIEGSVGSFVDESLARWQAFVAEAAAAKRVNVLDSYLFQNSVRVLLQMDADAPIDPLVMAAARGQ